jgi:hypothetical protein
LHDELLDRRNARRGRLAERARVGGDAPPADDPKALGGSRILDAAARAVLAQKDHRQSAPRPRNEHRCERKQDPGAVPGQAVGRDGATVPHAAEPLECGVEDRPRRAAAEVGDEADATRVAFVERAIQPKPLSEKKWIDPAYCD